MTAGLFAHHVPGHSWLHRMPLGAKLLGVLLVGLSTWVLDSWRPALVVLLALVAAGLRSGLHPRRIIRSVAALVPVLVLLGAFHWITRDLAYAARVVLGITSCFVAGGLVTATTPVTDMVDGAVRAASPLRRWVDPDVVALTLGVMFRSVPWVAGAFAQVRESARARGLDRAPRALVVPVVVRAVAYARFTGEALAARGLTDPPDDQERPPKARNVVS